VTSATTRAPTFVGWCLLLDFLREQKKEAEKDLLRESRKHPIVETGSRCPMATGSELECRRRVDCLVSTTTC
jgi:hypothetical protein